MTYLNNERDVRRKVPALGKLVHHERKFHENSVDVDPGGDAEEHDAHVNRKRQLAH